MSSHISLLLLIAILSGSAEVGVASWYGEYHYGKLTANGEVFNGEDLTFAHKTLPFGTVVKFYYNGRGVIARCNDRGPFIEGREFDLSYQVAKRLGFLEVGVDKIYYKIIKKEEVKNDFQRDTYKYNTLFRAFCID